MFSHFSIVSSVSELFLPMFVGIMNCVFQFSRIFEVSLSLLEFKCLCNELFKEPVFAYFDFKCASLKIAKLDVDIDEVCDPFFISFFIKHDLLVLKLQGTRAFASSPVNSSVCLFKFISASGTKLSQSSLDTLLEVNLDLPPNLDFRLTLSSFHLPLGDTGLE